LAAGFDFVSTFACAFRGVLPLAGEAFALFLRSVFRAFRLHCGAHPSDGVPEILHAIARR
jgi:hypothetical protein